MWHVIYLFVCFFIFLFFLILRGEEIDRVISDSIFYSLTSHLGHHSGNVHGIAAVLQPMGRAEGGCGPLHRNKTYPDPPVDRIGWLRQEEKRCLKEMTITGTMAVCQRAGNPAREIEECCPDQVVFMRRSWSWLSKGKK